MLRLLRTVLMNSAEAQPAEATLALTQASVVVIHTGHIACLLRLRCFDGTRLDAVVLFPVRPCSVSDFPGLLGHKLNLRLETEMVGVTMVAGFAWIR